MKGMILAAGLGTRLRPHTDHLPKPAIPILNVPLGYWPLFHLLKAGVRDLVVNTHHLPRHVEDLYQKQSKRLTSLNFTFEDGQILGSAGGVQNARQFLDGESSFYVANGDEVFLPTTEDVFDQVKSYHAKTGAIATLVVIKHPEVGSKFGGVWTDRTGVVRGFGKTPPAPDLLGYHYTGFQLLHPRVFKYIPATGESNIFYDALVAAIAAGERVQIVNAWGDWFETGNPADLLEATRVLLDLLPKNEMLKNLLWYFWPGYDAKKSLANSGTATVLKGDGVSVLPTASLSGFVVLGDGASVGANARLENVIVGPGAQVPAGANLANTIVLA